MGVLYIWGMKKDVYTDIEVDSKFGKFEFISEGHNGRILKRIEFTSTQWSGVYNLAFGDVKTNGELDDLKISNNGDRNKILATVLRVVDTYTKKYPERWLYFRGSTEDRTRLYRIAIGLHFEELAEKFEILADLNGDWDFVRFYKGLNVKAFLIKRKIIKFDI
jgi:hypothetical protein